MQLLTFPPCVSPSPFVLSLPYSNKRPNVPFAILLGWTPHPQVRLAGNLPLGLAHFTCTNYLACWDSWIWTDEAVVEEFRQYLDA